MPDSDMHCLICRSTCVTRHASFQRRTMCIHIHENDTTN